MNTIVRRGTRLRLVLEASGGLDLPGHGDVDCEGA